MKFDSIGNTAIVVFIRAVEEEARVKSFSYSNSRNQSKKILKELNRQVINLSKKTQLPVIIGNNKIQSGDSFGERIQSVCQRAFAKGFENLILIGNDCLTIDTSSLLQVKQQLTRNDVVLGPTSDGGIYLLGISKKAFHSIDLEKQLWQTSELFFNLKNNFHQENISVKILEVSEDVDDVFQLENTLRQFSKFSFFTKKIKGLLVERISFFIKKEIYIRQEFSFIFSLRGPPSF